jgi:hypothetical protein
MPPAYHDGFPMEFPRFREPESQEIAHYMTGRELPVAKSISELPEYFLRTRRRYGNRGESDAYPGK